MAKAAQITVRVTNEEYSSLRALAARQSVRLSDLVRTALAERIANHDKPRVLGRMFDFFAGSTIK